MNGSSGTGDSRGLLPQAARHLTAERTEISFWPTNWRALRRRMVRRDIATRGVTDRRLLAVMASLPREHFVPVSLRARAYADLPLPIGCGQTISQPYIVALMTGATQVTRKSRVLEIGTGSGYQTAILAKLAQHVWSVERLSDLADAASQRLRDLGITNVSLIHGDGTLGYPEAAPFDAVLVAAAAPCVPRSLIDQLAAGGRLVIPIGNRDAQQLTIYHRTARGVEKRTAGSCRFVPLVSPQAFAEQ